MPRAPRLTGEETLRGLQRGGWRKARQSGSHVILHHPLKAGARVVVPLHAGHILKPKTLASILDAAGLTMEEFQELT